MTRAELNAYIIANIYPNGRNEVTAPMVRDPMLAVVAFMGDAATYGVGGVAAGNGGLVTGGQVYSAINTALSSAVKFQGVTTTALTDGSTNPVITIDGESYTAHKGDEVIYGGREFLWTGSKWQQLGDEESWALKTITISAGAGLAGGGDLTQNRTLSLSQDSLDKLALAASAYQLPGTGIPLADLAAGVQTSLGRADSAYQKPTGGIPKTDLASAVQSTLTNADTIAGYFTNSKLDAAHLPDLYVARTQVSGTAANKTLYGVNAISYAGGYDANDKSLIEWDDTNKVWHVHGGLYAEGVLSGGGLSQSSPGGGGGLDPALMWKYLTNDPTLSDNPYANTKIAAAHLPDLNPGTGVTASYTGNLYLNLSLNYSAVAGQLGLSGMAYKPANQQTIIDALGYTPVNPSSLGSMAYASTGDYVTKTGDTMTGTLQITKNKPLIINYTRCYAGSGGWADSLIEFRKADGTTFGGVLGWFGNDNTPAFFYLGLNEAWDSANNFRIYSSGVYWGNNEIYHAGNLSPITTTNWGNYIGTSTAPVGYATYATYDSASHQISTYYLPLSGGTMTGTLNARDILPSANYSYNLGNSSYEWVHASIRDITTRHLDADDAVSSDHSLYIGYGASNYTDRTLFYYSSSTSSRTQFAEINSNGLYALTRFGVNGQNTSYNLYVNGSAYASSLTLNGPIDGATNILIRKATRSDLDSIYDLRWNYGQYDMGDYGGAYASEYPTAYGQYISFCFDNNNSAAIMMFDTPAWSTEIGHVYVRTRGAGTVTQYSAWGKLVYAGDNYAANYITAGSTTVNTSSALYVYGVAYATTGLYTDGYLSGGGLSQSSDQRLKDALADFGYTPGLLMALRPREWDWNGNTPMKGHAAGFVAQEVEGLLPYFVDNAREYKALFYDQFHALEVSALQDHERRIVELEKAVEDRDRQIAELRQRLNMN